MYPYNIVLFFLFFSVWYKHTKTHALPFYLFMKLESPSRPVYSWKYEFSSYLLPTSFQWKALGYNNLVLILKRFLFLLLFQVQCLYVFLHFLYFFSENQIVHQPKRIFFTFTRSFFAFLALLSFRCIDLAMPFY